MVNSVISSIIITTLFQVSFMSFSYVYYAHISSVRKKWKTNILWLTPIVSVVFIMNNGYVLSNGFIVDFRYITLMLATLYGGYVVGFLTLISIIITAFFLTPYHVITTAIISALLFLLFSLVHTHVIHLDIKKKRKYVGYIFLLFTGSTSIYYFQYLDFKESVIIACYVVLSFILARAYILYIGFLDNFIYLTEQVTRLEKSLLVSEMAASITHEIRNPLTSTKGFLQLIKEGNLSKDDSEKYLEIAIDGINRADEVLTDYLMFSKPDANKEICIKTEEEIIKVINLVYPLASKNKVKIEFMSRNDNIFVFGNQMKFRQCILNIVKNSVESMPYGGMITIQLLQMKKRVYINVIDTGHGMSSIQLSNLGRAYFTTKDGGTGLGLLVVYNIIEKMNGKIFVSSKLDVGTKFSIVLPEYNLEEV